MKPPVGSQVILEKVTSPKDKKTSTKRRANNNNIKLSNQTKQSKISKNYPATQIGKA